MPGGEEVVNALTTKIFSAMLEDILMDVTLQSHHEVLKSRALCPVCQTQCGSLHAPASSKSTGQNQSSLSRASSLDLKVTNGSVGTGTSTPTNAKGEGVYLECVNCGRQIASSRYAPHLNSCMGLASARRSGGRSMNAKLKHPSETGRSISPTSEMGNMSDDSRNAKGRSRAKRVDDAEFNLKRKRPTSPQVSPNKKAKRPKPSGSPVSRVKADYPNPTHYSPSLSHSKIPSKLRDSSLAPTIERSPTPSSRDSSPGVASAATPTSSSFSGQSPSITAKSIGNGKPLNNRAMGIGPPKRISPPKPLPVHVPSYVEVVDGGEETGSSTDTDSS
ncbi:hypothetical protein BDN72DRAFT_13970 [Pluteus cervinus]|uniref:Uncharacterized protein n=1 Tax=Pluteus cervinus TaxID=181527 RepID=A0ACD3BFN8_9AGAR|nr:hypothetical protein BDN72DRAFT_13970 [Pluteus cervinus]